MAGMGIPYVAYAEMLSPDDVFAAVVSPDPEVSKTMLSGETPFSTTANSEIGQTVSSSGVFTEHVRHVYRHQ